MMERLDAFMARANAAYYATQDPFADFTTAPEISQVFGELLGLWAVVVWRSMGAPDTVILAEAGPGRGTLMADALRAIGRTCPALRAALRLHLLETSPRLRALQAERLPDAVWHDDLADIPAGPLLLFANEFLDALPIRQFLLVETGWAERYVENGAFVERPADPPPRPARTGDIIEINEPALDFAQALAARIGQSGGAALLIDYGPAESAAGDSLQALRQGKPAPPLLAPGEADLTAHVDFQAIAQAARAAGAAVHGPLAQGLFLTRLGLFQRTDMLARTQHAAGVASLIAASRRLAEPDGMGRLFKVLALCHPALPAPPGFDA
jgi:NADH dehydrogenase [ubiquinone] 1 alpha subcomplex assembly factor 7